MKRIILFAIILGVGGLVVGYLLFGKFAGEYVQIQQLIFNSDNFFQKIAKTITGIEEMRRKILITGGAGAGLGVLIGVFLKK